MKLNARVLVAAFAACALVGCKSGEELNKSMKEWAPAKFSKMGYQVGAVIHDSWSEQSDPRDTGAKVCYDLEKSGRKFVGCAWEKAGYIGAGWNIVPK